MDHRCPERAGHHGRGRPRRGPRRGRPRRGPGEPVAWWAPARAGPGSDRGVLHVHGDGWRFGPGVLGRTRSRRQPGWPAAGVVPDPDATAGRVQRRPDRRVRGARRGFGVPRLGGGSADPDDRRAGAGCGRRDAPPRCPPDRGVAADGGLVASPARWAGRSAGPRSRGRSALQPHPHRTGRGRHLLPSLRVHPSRSGVRTVHRITGIRRADHGHLRSRHHARPARRGLHPRDRHRQGAWHRAPGGRRGRPCLRPAERDQRPAPPRRRRRHRDGGRCSAGVGQRHRRPEASRPST